MEARGMSSNLGKKGKKRVLEPCTHVLRLIHPIPHVDPNFSCNLNHHLRGWRETSPSLLPTVAALNHDQGLAPAPSTSWSVSRLIEPKIASGSRWPDRWSRS